MHHQDSSYILFLTVLLLPHTIIGATIATKFDQPILILAFAFLSHFILDALPHWNPHLNTEIKTLGKISKKTTIICLVDAGLALIIGLALALRFSPDNFKVLLVLGACFAAILPDLAEAPYFFFGWRNKFFVNLISFQKKIQANIPFVPGVAIQFVILTICLYLLFT